MREVFSEGVAAFVLACGSAVKYLVVILLNYLSDQKAAPGSDGCPFQDAMSNAFREIGMFIK